VAASEHGGKPYERPKWGSLAERRLFQFFGKNRTVGRRPRRRHQETFPSMPRRLTPESLSMAADDYKQGLPVAKKWARDILELSKVEKVEAA
jgi:hypothetical protein